MWLISPVASHDCASACRASTPSIFEAITAAVAKLQPSVSTPQSCPPRPDHQSDFAGRESRYLSYRLKLRPKHDLEHFLAPPIAEGEASFPGVMIIAPAPQWGVL